MNWDLIRAFLALHHAGTFEGAAQMLSIDHSTMRRRIQTLEIELGSTLFVRNDGRYSVRPSKRHLLDSATRMQVSSHNFFKDLDGSGSGTVRVTMMDVFAGWLASDLQRFHRNHPNILLDITTEHYFVDLEREMVDVAIRLARPTKGASRLRKLCEVGYGVYASPEYAARRTMRPAGSGDDLLTLSVHYLHRDHEFLAGETNWMLERLPHGNVVGSTDSYLALKHYCEAGMGLALLPEVLVDPEGGLVRVDDRATQPSCDLWLVINAETASTQRVRAFVDFIGPVFADRMAALNQAAARVKPASDVAFGGPIEKPMRAVHELHPR